MNFGFLTNGVKIPFRRFLAVAILFGTTLAWFYVFHGYLLEEILTSPGRDLFWIDLGNLLFYSSIVFSGIIGSLISERVDRRKFLFSWIAFGFLTTASVAVFQGLEFTLLSTILLGVSFGLGFPSCQAFLTESTAIEERGRIAGIVIFGTFTLLVFIVLGSSPSLFNLEVVEVVWICVGLKAISFLALLVDPCAREKGKETSWLNILTSSDFSSYLVPWLMFHIANGILLFIELPFDYESVETIGRAFEFLGTVLTALISGLLADHIGRKPPILVGLLMLGISYAVFGLITSPLTFLIAMVTEGVAWGLIAVAYMQVVLGDLSDFTGSKERVYTLGGIVIPLFMYTIFSVIADWTAFSIPANALSQFLSIILFASVVPVWLASETLSKEKVHEWKMKEYVKKLGKVVEEERKTD